MCDNCDNLRKEIRRGREDLTDLTDPISIALSKGDIKGLQEKLAAFVAGLKPSQK
jgi:hypothetical protein